jgi:hypothetical protein
MVSIASLTDWMFILIVAMSLKGETRFVSRASIVANTVSIFSATAHHWDVIPWPFQAYAVIGLAFWAIAFLSYMWGSSVDYRFYDSAWWLYNTVFATIHVVAAGFLG